MKSIVSKTDFHIITMDVNVGITPVFSTQQLNRELRTQVSDTSKSASLLYIIIN